MLKDLIWVCHPQCALCTDQDWELQSWHNGLPESDW